MSILPSQNYLCLGRDSCTKEHGGLNVEHDTYNLANPKPFSQSSEDQAVQHELDTKPTCNWSIPKPMKMAYVELPLSSLSQPIGLSVLV